MPRQATLSPAQFYQQHAANLRAVGLSDTRTASEIVSGQFSFKFGNLFSVSWVTGQPRRFWFSRRVPKPGKPHDQLAQDMGTISVVALRGVLEFHRWWNYLSLIRLYVALRRGCENQLRREEQRDEAMQKVLLCAYFALLVVGAIGSALWGAPRYFSALSNLWQGRKTAHATNRLGNFFRRALFLIPLCAVVGGALAIGGLGWPVGISLGIGALCGFCFSLGWGAYSSKHGVFSAADEKIDIEGKFIPKKAWLKKIARWPGFEDQAIAMYTYAYLTNKMLAQTGWNVSQFTSQEYKKQFQNTIEYQLRKQFKDGELFDVVRYLNEEYQRLHDALFPTDGRYPDYTATVWRTIRTDFDMLSWLLSTIYARAGQSFQVPVPGYYTHGASVNAQFTPTIPANAFQTYRHQVREQVQVGPVFQAGYQPDKLPTYEEAIAEKPPVYQAEPSVPGYTPLQESVGQRGQHVPEPSAPPKEEICEDVYKTYYGYQ